MGSLRSTMNQQFHLSNGSIGARDEAERQVFVAGIAGQNMTALPLDFVPGENDVICGRGRKAFSHIGNERFRRLVEGRLAEYSSASSKLEKSYILSDIVVEVRQISPNGGFVKRDTQSGRWYEVGDFLAREKTSQAFRDALHDQYKSSNTAKKKRRQAEQADRSIQDQGSSTSLCYDGSSSYDGHSSYSLGQSNSMHGGNRFDQDSLLGAFDVEIKHTNMLNNHLHNNNIFQSSLQNSATSVLDYAPNPQPSGQLDWAHQSCPNLGWNQPDSLLSSMKVLHDDVNHRSAPDMSFFDFDMESPPRSSQPRAIQMPASYGRPSLPVDDSMNSESLDDDFMLSPIGDGSPRRLFNSLSRLDEVADLALDPERI